jgi:uncharacterized protein YndB with AHSA1/START domain
VARNEILAMVPAEAVWEVLSDPRLYVSWVVGASGVRQVEGRWPQVGAVLHHTQIIAIRDTTSVLASEPGRRLVLEARARPAVVARVELTLEPDAAETRIVMQERATGGLAALLPTAVNDPLIHARNAISVGRLRRLAEIGRQLGRS